MGAVTDGRIDYLAANQAAWEAQADTQMRLARRNWNATPNWGIFGIPESEVGLLPADLQGRDAAELGCGTAYVSAWLAQRGARPIAVDPTVGQLRIARQMQEE